MEELDQRIHAEAVQRACSLMEEVIPDDLRMAVHSRCVEEMLGDGLAGLDGAALPGMAGEVRVSSAYRLSPDERAALEGELRRRLGEEAEIREEHDPGLIAGLTVGVGGLVVDGSLRHRVQEAAKNVQRAAGD